MDVNLIKAKKEKMENDILNVIEDFEINTGFIVEEIILKRNTVGVGVGTREAINKVIIRAALP